LEDRGMLKGYSKEGEEKSSKHIQDVIEEGGSRVGFEVKVSRTKGNNSGG